MSSIQPSKLLASALIVALTSLGATTTVTASAVAPPPTTTPPPTACSFSSTVISNFNGTPIAAENTIWFNSVMKLQNAPSTSHAVNIYVTNATVTFQDNSGNTYTVAVPNAQVTFDPNATTATTSFDANTNTWVTDTPYGTAGNTFLDAVALTLANSLPGGIKPVTWDGQISSDTAGVTINWQWAAAVYTNFSSNYALLDVKPTDDTKASSYQNSDHAGTPETYKPYVIGGARGGGGSNWTGSYSGTMSQTCQADANS
ncbi:hypothetical protein [Dyella acidisoli]|nr:hypothetical protein [Dyella acidisoli]